MWKIRLRFEETAARTHEFWLAWAEGIEQPLHTIVRQQWTFSPNSTTEREQYDVKLDGVSVLQLAITPDISGAEAIATIEEFVIGVLD